MILITNCQKCEATPRLRDSILVTELYWRPKPTWKCTDERQNTFLHCVIYRTKNDYVKQLDMFSLKKQRIWGDTIEVLKILYKFDKINPGILFEMNNATVTRGNGMKLKVRRCNTIARKSYFNVRVVDLWNKLPTSIVSWNTIDSFKSQLYIYMSEKQVIIN